MLTSSCFEVFYLKSSFTKSLINCIAKGNGFPLKMYLFPTKLETKFYQLKRLHFHFSHLL